jgi:hypothetical protein
MLYEESYNEFDRFFVFLVIVIVLYDPKKASILVFVPLDKNFMQMGGFIPARASIELGKVHIPSRKSNQKPLLAQKHQPLPCQSFPR